MTLNALTATSDLAMLPLATLRKLKNASQAIRLLGWLLILPALWFLLVGIRASMDSSQTLSAGLLPALFAAGLACSFASIGLITRQNWGRPLGIAVSGLMLPVFPLGTLLGIMGLSSLLPYPQLFGTAAIRHEDIMAAWIPRQSEQYRAQR